MNEILFLVEQAEDGGFIAKAIHESIYTQADDIDELHANIRDAVACHFDTAVKPKFIHLHFVRDEVIAA